MQIIKLTKMILMFLFILSICYIIYMALVNTHETAHAKICEYNGGNASIKINYLKMGGVTHCDYKGEKPETAILADSLNEVVGYHYRHFVIFMLFLMIWIFLKSDKSAK